MDINITTSSTSTINTTTTAAAIIATKIISVSCHYDYVHIDILKYLCY